jgi:hypothetical protein
MEQRGSGRKSRSAWTIVQVVGVIATAVLIAGLVWRPEPFLALLWKVLIPLVPAVLLISPLLWRNVCPLATLEMAAGNLMVDRPPARRWATQGAAAGILLLAILVPARHMIFNTQGPVLAITIAAVAAVAIGGGVAFDAKGGFCNAICPVLPVERLYGQDPLLEIGNPRCPTCSACAPSCIDLGPRTASLRALGAARRRADWTGTPFGAFAAAFPGFVLGYFTTADGSLATAPWTYAQIAAWSGISWIVTAAVVAGWKVAPERALPVLAALAAGTYYVFAAPQMAAAVGLQEAGSILRAVFLTLVAVWWWRAERRRRVRAGARPTGQGLRAA